MAMLLALLQQRTMASITPTGADRVVTINEDSSYTFALSDWGFSDAGDTPPNAFTRVYIEFPPTAGKLVGGGLVDPMPVTHGTFVEVFPAAGRVWTRRDSARDWNAVASSGDGSKLVATVRGGQIYTSADSGVSWNAHESNRNWQAVASSADGLKVAAVVGGDSNLGQVYLSADAGLTWTPSATARNWQAIASSADGTKLVAVADMIYTSIDSGSTWTARETARNWRTVTSSADGMRLVAGVDSGTLYLSSDGGQTWVPGETTDSWISIASSSDGTVILASSTNYVYVSHDAGLTWEKSDLGRMDLRLACSADGRKKFALSSSWGMLASVDDHGWFQRSSGVGSYIACSLDGERLVAAGAATINTSVTSVPILRYTPAPDANGSSYAKFCFQVEDDGDWGSRLEPGLHTMTINVLAVDDDPPALVHFMQDQVAARGAPFSYQVPADTLVDPDAGTVLSYTASLHDGGPLPPWLNFHPGTRTFSGTPTIEMGGPVAVKVTATDNGTPQRSGSTLFNIMIPSTAPTGTDGSATLNEDTAYRIDPSDFGFSDPADSPPNRFTRLKITSLPINGTLWMDGHPVSAGAVVSMIPSFSGTWDHSAAHSSVGDVFLSTDGSKILTTADSRIIASDNFGTTWTPLYNAPPYTFSMVASADASKLAATNYSGLFTSTDGGLTWVPRRSDLSFRSLASSADGSKLMGTTVGKTPYFYRSVDSGLSWSSAEAPADCAHMVCSADGQRLLCTSSFADMMSHSADGGLSWNRRGIGLTWSAVATSADGSFLVAIALGDGSIWTSTNFGESWTQRNASVRFDDVTVSADGRTIAAIGWNKVFISQDSGQTWTPTYQADRAWDHIKISADGSTLCAVQADGYLRVANAPLPNLIYIPGPNTYGTAYDSFTFQVIDDGLGSNIDPTPKTFVLNVNSVNDAPILTLQPIPPKGIEHTPYVYQIPATTFVDPDGDVLSYSASGLPSWLNFDPTTRTLSGTPPDARSISVIITASDAGSPPLQESVLVRLVSTNVDDPPDGTDATLYMHLGQGYNFHPADFGFTDPLDLVNNNFSRVRIATLPATGTLSLDGSPVTIGSYYALPRALGEVWTPRESSRTWKAVALSADGLKILAAAANSRLLTSVDGGASWTARESIRNWQAVASSSDGATLAAADSSRIYISTDAGVTWTASGPVKSWTALACSTNGDKLVAVGTNSQIYTSTNFGGTWTARGTSQTWSSVASSADGTQLVAAVYNGQIYVSSDSGVAWTIRSPSISALKNISWISITSSADGQKLALMSDYNEFYTSTNAGINWVPRSQSRIKCLACSADGNRLVAFPLNGRIGISDNQGGTWRFAVGSQSWVSGGISSDGNTIMGGTNGGRLYTSKTIPAHTLAYSPVGPPVGTNSVSFDFQVEDDGEPGSNLDITPNTLTLNLSTPFETWALANGLPTNPNAETGGNLLRFAFGLPAVGATGGTISINNGIITQYGPPTVQVPDPEQGLPFRALFGRRKQSGLIYTVQFSANLTTWQASQNAPTILADDGTIEACAVAFPSTLAPTSSAHPNFFRIVVNAP